MLGGPSQQQQQPAELAVPQQQLVVVTGWRMKQHCLVA